MIISKHDSIHLNLTFDDPEQMEEISSCFTAYVPNYFHMPLFKAGIWDGKVKFLNPDGSLPYGLLSDLLKFIKKLYPNEPVKLTDDIVSIYKGQDVTPIYNLSKEPWYYQKDCIETGLKYSKGIIRSATASGKSLIISYIIKTLMENNVVKHCLIVVPTISLVEQFYTDMIEYGIDKELLGRVYEKYKDFEKTIVISTWQTMSKNHKFLPNYGCVIFDECHQVKSQEINKIAKKCIHATYRLGFTGTLPTDKLDMWNIKAYVGPVLKEYSSGQLSEEGYISKCNINVIKLIHNNDYDGEYIELKQNVFKNELRLKLLLDIAEKVDGNILILVGQIKKEGDILLKYIEKRTKKTVIFLNGKTDVEEREYWRKICETKKDTILIATYPIFQQGINIPSLKYILLAAPFKSKIRVLQSIGRALRKHSDKIDGAEIYDIIDDIPIFIKHGNDRLKYYQSEGFKITKSTISITDMLLIER